MKPAAQPISNQRLDRLMLWSKLWLLRIAAFILQTAGLFAPLERKTEAALKPWLDKFAQGILALIVLKADRHLQAPVQIKRYAPHKIASSFQRRWFGARLRKLARAKPCGARVAALLKLIDSAEKEIARFVKRVRAGLTRRRGGVARDTYIFTCENVRVPLLALSADTS